MTDQQRSLLIINPSVNRGAPDDVLSLAREFAAATVVEESLQAAGDLGDALVARHTSAHAVTVYSSTAVLSALPAGTIDTIIWTVHSRASLQRVFPSERQRPTRLKSGGSLRGQPYALDTGDLTLIADLRRLLTSTGSLIVIVTIGDQPADTDLVDLVDVIVAHAAQSGLDLTRLDSASVPRRPLTIRAVCAALTLARRRGVPARVAAATGMTFEITATDPSQDTRSVCVDLNRLTGQRPTTSGPARVPAPAARLQVDKAAQAPPQR